jgi:hypothetical protein
MVLLLLLLLGGVGSWGRTICHSWCGSMVRATPAARLLLLLGLNCWLCNFR